MAETKTRARAARKPRPVEVDIAFFDEVVEAALVAIGEDVSYAVAMARAAVTIDRKRAAWQVRKDLRQAEAQAHAECRHTPQFTCHTASPCGTGDCKFALGEMAVLDVPDCDGVSERPQYNVNGAYSIDAAVAPLLELRGSSS